MLQSHSEKRPMSDLVRFAAQRPADAVRQAADEVCGHLQPVSAAQRCQSLGQIEFAVIERATRYGPVQRHAAVAQGNQVFEP